MTKIKTPTLTGEKLAAWTARAQKWRIVEFRNDNEDERQIWFDSSDVAMYPVNDCALSDGYRPDINGWQAMELVKKFNVSLEVYEDGSIRAHIHMEYMQYGMKGEEEKLICRAVVASVFGKEVDDAS